MTFIRTKDGISSSAILFTVEYCSRHVRDQDVWDISVVTLPRMEIGEQATSQIQNPGPFSSIFYQKASLDYQHALSRLFSTLELLVAIYEGLMNFLLLMISPHSRVSPIDDEMKGDVNVKVKGETISISFFRSNSTHCGMDE